MNAVQGILPLISILAFASMAMTRLCDPMLTTLSAEFNVPFQTVTRVISWYAIAYGAMQLIFGPLSEKFGKARIIVGVSFAGAVLSFMAALASDFTFLVWVRVALGAAAAAIIPLSMAWIGDLVTYENRQAVLARLMVATVSGLMAGQALGGYCAEHIGWRWAFGILGTLFLLGATFLFVQVGRSAAARHDASSAAHPLFGHVLQSIRLLKLPRVRWVLFVVALEGCLAFGPLSLCPTLLVESFGFTVTSAGFVMMLYGGGGLIYAAFAKRWLQAFGERGLALLGGTLLGLSFLLFAFAQAAVLAEIACALGGLGFYMLHNTLQTQATQMAPEARGSAVALFASLLFIGQSIGVSVSVSIGHLTSLATAFAGASVMLPILGAYIARSLAHRR